MFTGSIKKKKNPKNNEQFSSTENPWFPDYVF